MGSGVWSIAIFNCTSRGVGRGPQRRLFVQILESGGGGGGWSIATIIFTSLGVGGVVHSDDSLYKSWSRGCGT